MSFFIKLFLVLQLLFGGIVSGITHGCPGHWKSFGGSCYLKVHTAVTWTEANYHCKHYGGQLVRIESKQINLFLLNEFLKNGKHRCWFGLHRCGGNKWCFPEWNIASLFSNWNKGEPNNYGGYEGCGIIGAGGHWYDTDCRNSYPYICQKNIAMINLQAQKNALLRNLKNNQQEIKVSLSKIENSLSDVKEKLKKLPKNPKLGSYQNPGTSCLDILTRATEILSSGEYWINIDSNGPMKVFCDMKANGGGWTLVTNIVLSDSNGFNWSPATDYRQISNYNNNKLGIFTSALGKLKSNMPFTQLRFHCQKKIPGRTIDIVTKNNVLGKHVAQYITGKTNYFPKACGSFARLPADNSIMAQECYKWGKESGKYNVGKWSHERIVPLNERLYNHAFFIGFKAHWLVPFSKGGRWECDDFITNKGFARSTGDFWKIYVR